MPLAAPRDLRFPIGEVAHSGGRTSVRGAHPLARREGAHARFLWQEDLWKEIIRAADSDHPDQTRFMDMSGFDARTASQYAATPPELLRWFDGYNERQSSGRKLFPLGFSCFCRRSRASKWRRMSRRRFPMNSGDVGSRVADHLSSAAVIMSSCLRHSAGRPAQGRAIVARHC